MQSLLNEEYFIFFSHECEIWHKFKKLLNNATFTIVSQQIFCGKLLLVSKKMKSMVGPN